MRDHNRPQGLGWPNPVVAAVERASQPQRPQIAPWIVPRPPPLPQALHPPPRLPPAPPPPPPPPHLPSATHHRPVQHPPLYPPAIGQNVIAIHDSDSDDNFQASRPKKKKRKVELLAKSHKNQNEQSSSDTNGKAQRPGTGNRRHGRPAAPTGSLPLAGVFVSGVLTGRLLETEREANQERAFSNIIMGATGHDRRAVVNPPPHITLSLDQVRQLGNGFLEDRNHAVREAVHIAHTEMKEKHDEIVRKLKESLQKEKASRTEAEDVLKTVNNEANNHVAERIRLSAENVQLREQLSHRADIEITSQHVIRLSAENEDLKIKLEERDDEIEYLRKHLSPTPSRKKKSKDEDALKEKIASLNEELEYQKKRAARSIAALKEASVRSLRLVQSQRIED